MLSGVCLWIALKMRTPGIRKLIGHKSRLEERDRGFCAKRLRRISSGFWGALTLNWSKNESAVGSSLLDASGSC